MSRSVDGPRDGPPSLPRARRAAMVWGAFLLALTSWPSPPHVPVVSDIPSIDKVAHGLLYGVWAFLLYRATRWPGRPGFSLARALVIVGAVAVFGTADETHQAFIPGRSMEAMDAVMDTAGGAAGAFFAAARRRKEVAALRPANELEGFPVSELGIPRFARDDIGVRRNADADVTS